MYKETYIYSKQLFIANARLHDKLIGLGGGGKGGGGEGGGRSALNAFLFPVQTLIDVVHFKTVQLGSNI